jgi:hypothetical protein
MFTHHVCRKGYSRTELGDGLLKDVSEYRLVCFLQPVKILSGVATTTPKCLFIAGVVSTSQLLECLTTVSSGNQNGRTACLYERNSEIRICSRAGSIVHENRKGMGGKKLIACGIRWWLVGFRTKKTEPPGSILLQSVADFV